MPGQAQAQRQRLEGYVPPSVIAAIDQWAQSNGVRVDAPQLNGESLGNFSARQLEFMVPGVVEAKVPRNNALSSLPVASNVPFGAQTYTVTMRDGTGEADWIGDWSDDLPSVDVFEVEETFKTGDFGDSYGWNLKELAQAQFTGKPLQASKAEQARRVIMAKHNKVAWLGDASKGLYGALSYPWIPREILPSPISAATTPDAILAMLNGLPSGVVERTRGIEEPDTMKMPIAAYNYINDTPRSATSDTTILSHFLANNQFITEVSPVDEMRGAGPGGEDLIFVYRRGDPSAVRYEAIEVFMPQTPQARNLAVVVNALGATGGVASEFPLANVVGVLPAA